MMLQIKDRPGCISAAEMREHFERTVTETLVIKKNTPLGAITVNGEFIHYADPDTDTMWIGFALGMRAAERVAAARAQAKEGGK